MCISICLHSSVKLLGWKTERKKLKLSLCSSVPNYKGDSVGPTVGLATMQITKPLQCWQSNLGQPPSKKRSTHLTYKEETFQISVYILVYSCNIQGQLLWCLCLHIILLAWWYGWKTDPRVYDRKVTCSCVLQWCTELHSSRQKPNACFRAPFYLTAENVHHINTILQKVLSLLVMKFP